VIDEWRRYLSACVMLRKAVIVVVITVVLFFNPGNLFPGNKKTVLCIEEKQAGIIFFHQTIVYGSRIALKCSMRMESR